MVDLISGVPGFAASGWLGRLDLTAEQSLVMNYCPVAERLDDAMVDLRERRGLLVELQVSSPEPPHSFSSILQGLRARSRTSGSQWLR